MVDDVLVIIYLKRHGYVQFEFHKTYNKVPIARVVP